MTICSQTRRHLVAIAKSLASEKRGLLEQLKTEYNQLERPDFVWHYLLQSFATMGSAKGWDGLIGNRDNYQRVTFDALSQLSPSRRLSVLEQTLRDAKVRWPVRKAGWLARNLDKIIQMGGLATVKALLLDKSGRAKKSNF